MGFEEIATQGTTVSKISPFPKVKQRKQKVPLSQLINKLNRLNFKEEPLLFNLKHKLHGHTISLYANPEPCMDAELECFWQDVDESNIDRFRAFDLVNFIMTDGQRSINVEPSLLSINERQITVKLPEESFETHSRSIKRHCCPDINVSIVANSSVYNGELLDFNAFFLRIVLSTKPPQSFDWINSNIPVNLTLSDNAKVIYIGDCKIVRQTDGTTSREFVLEPSRNQFPRFKTREFRSERSELLPNLNVSFKHPLTDKTMTLKMVDLSGSGFALEERHEDATLLPGMLLENVGILLTSRTRLSCTAQVIHRTHLKEGETVKVGLALLDMDPLEHMELISLLQQTKDPDTYVSNQVDTDTLWDFFFDTGFIYPQKYASLVKKKEQFKQTYNKLYTQHPNIARHFIHMQHNTILSHFAMLRLYEKTWCLHHHAAVAGKRKSGLIVLDRLCDFINDTHILDSAKTQYTTGFYRTNNKFPVKFYGGATDYLDNPKACSIDDFAYLHFSMPVHVEEEQNSERWTLCETTCGDLEDLQGFYEKVSGGLFLDAFDLTPEEFGSSTITEDYSNSGFKREIHHLSLRKHGDLKAVLAINQTDVGLNFSDLTNAVHMFVMDSSGFSIEDFNRALANVSTQFKTEKFPVMVYPTSFMDDKNIFYEKTYRCNVISSHYWDGYMRYLHDFLKKAKVR